MKWIVMEVQYRDMPPSRKILAIKDSKQEALEFINIPGAWLSDYGGFVSLHVGTEMMNWRPMLEIQPFDESETNE